MIFIPYLSAMSVICKFKIYNCKLPIVFHKRVHVIILVPCESASLWFEHWTELHAPHCTAAGGCSSTSFQPQWVQLSCFPKDLLKVHFERVTDPIHLSHYSRICVAAVAFSTRIPNMDKLTNTNFRWQRISMLEYNPKFDNIIHQSTFGKLT